MKSRVENAIRAAIDQSTASSTPPQLRRALQHAVFPGGARVRPQICLAVASACGDDAPKVADGIAAAIELLHCASLVHDDLPCFDDAPYRRGKATVHLAFGEPIAILTGDALIVMAFETLGRAAAEHPERLPALLALLAEAVGSKKGLVAGQAWESEPATLLEEYHQAKTGALFVAASVGGALAAGADSERWREMGRFIGRAYQVADDLRDVISDPETLGKPVDRDAALCRPSAVSELGVEGAKRRLSELIEKASEAVPSCPGAPQLRALIAAQASRLMPKDSSKSVA